MLDNKGYFYIIDAVIAVVLLLMVFLVINAAISIPSSDYTYESRDIRQAQDIMEILDGKVNFTDQTFLEKISNILQNGKNSKDSIRQVSKISDEKLSSFNLKNYRFSENNVLNEKIIASSGDYSKASDVSTATRYCGDYSYTLCIW